MLYDWFHWAFGYEHTDSELSLAQVAARSVLLFLVALAAVRIGKSRLLGRSTPIDIILGFVLGSVLGRGIGGAMSIAESSVAIITLVSTHWALTWITCHWHSWGQVFKGSCHSLIDNGEVLQANLMQSHISDNDLLEALRLQVNTEDLGRVLHAYKERSGDISFVLREPPPRVIEVAVAAGVQTVRIELSGS